MLDFNDAKPQLHVIDTAQWEARMEHLRARLKGSALELIKEIFPAARIQSNEARIGSIEGDRGESLSIALTGESAGLWTDHATGEGGDLIDLWRRTQGYADFAQAVKELEEWLGIDSQRPRFRAKIAKVGSERKAKADREPQTDTSLGAPTHSCYFYSAEGAILGVERRYELSTGDKTYRLFNASSEAKAPDPRPLYRQPEIRTADTVVFVEGAKCAEALASIGIEATAAMGGANALLEKVDWTPLAGKTVILWPDNDPTNETPKSQVGQRFMDRVRPILEGIGCTVSTIAIPDDAPANGWDAADAIADGRDVATILSSTQESKHSSPLRFKILTIAELANVKPPEWRIDGIFPTHGSSTIYGAYESFKTWVALDMLLCLAAGRPWHERDIKPCPVLYIAGEGQHGLAHRVLGWCSARNEGLWPTTFRALPEAVAMSHTGDLDDLLRAVDTMPEPPGVIALDTITRMSGGGSLNDEKDMQGYVRGMDRLRLATGAHIMNVGHSGKDKEKGLLGSIVLPAAMETIICVERKIDAVTLINSNPKGKQKDGPNFEDIRLVSRKVRFERDGKQDDTLIFLPDQEIVRSPETKPAQSLGPLQQKIMAAIEQATRSGQKLGFNALAALVGGNDGSLGKALRKLTERGLLVELEVDGGRRWVTP